jgi:NADH-quinone oxidoreductase subunit J
VAIYAASALGALAVALLLPRQSKQRARSVFGALLGCAAIGALWAGVCPCACGKVADAGASLGIDVWAFRYHYVFGLLALVAAVRVITHTRPVYAALWFILVVLSCAGLFLTLEAEFVATAAVIIYGGAILVTYMFVIMLASPPQDNKAGSDTPDGQPHDRVAREPWWACLTGFILLATLLTVAFDKQLPMGNPKAAEPAITVLEPGTVVGNTQEVGLNLFQQHPFAIELAGILLLISLIGAVVIAKMKVSNEDEVIPPAEAPAR